MAPRGGWPDRVVRLGEVTSTMDEARARAQAHVPHGTTVVARAQTSGRGRSGNGWESPAEAGLYATTVLYPAAAHALASVSLALGLGCAEALLGLGAKVALKWPNDLLFGDGKLGGLLLQHEPLGPTGTCLLFGFGINLQSSPPKPSHQRQPPQNAKLALAKTDLRAAMGGAEVAAKVVLDAILKSCELAYADWLARGLSPELCRRYDALHALFGHNVVASRTGGGTVTGTAAGLQPCGGLLLTTASGPEVVRAGAVFRVRSALGGT